MNEGRAGVVTTMTHLDKPNVVGAFIPVGYGDTVCVSRGGYKFTDLTYDNMVSRTICPEKNDYNELIVSPDYKMIRWESYNWKLFIFI